MTSPVKPSGVVPVSTVSPLTASPGLSRLASYGVAQSPAGSADWAVPEASVLAPIISPSAAVVDARTRARRWW
ncbi:unannotated protein [freshwater metagenome]|uniref:Unannotated protein n=1 Tax=freshwater metagenome TaxID=449393 RepID=A0A6J6QW21_9ZZZZ